MPFIVVRPVVSLLRRSVHTKKQGSRAAECGQQFPPSDGDCHTPLPCEVRKGRISCHECAVFTSKEGKMLAKRPTNFRRWRHAAVCAVGYGENPVRQLERA